MNLSDLQGNLNKFSWPQLVSNNDGKTSATGFCGVITILTGVLCFIAGVVDKMYLTHTTDVMLYSSGLITLGSTLLGVRKMKQGKSISDEATTLANILPLPPTAPVV